MFLLTFHQYVGLQAAHRAHSAAWAHRAAHTESAAGDDTVGAAGVGTVAVAGDAAAEGDETTPQAGAQVAVSGSSPRE